MKKTKIVCTIGPASEERQVFKQLVENGLNVARLNFSHGSHEEHLGRINMIKSVREELGAPVAIMLDTKGPEIRTGKFSVPVVTLVEGQTFTLTTEKFMGTQDKCQVSYEGLPNDVVVGDKILIDDGLIELEVKAIKGPEIETIVLNAGDVKNNKGAREGSASPVPEPPPDRRRRERWTAWDHHRAKDSAPDPRSWDRANRLWCYRRRDC